MNFTKPNDQTKVTEWQGSHQKYVMSAEDPTEATRCDVTLLKQCNITWHHQVSKKKPKHFIFS